jgi:hypothetical protein
MPELPAPKQATSIRSKVWFYTTGEPLRSVVFSDYSTRMPRYYARTTGCLLRSVNFRVETVYYRISLHGCRHFSFLLSFSVTLPKNWVTERHLMHGYIWGDLFEKIDGIGFELQVKQGNVPNQHEGK